MDLKVKLLNDKAVLPFYATDGAAALDLTATSVKRDKNNNLVYGLGIALEIPQGYFGYITSRSSIKDKDLRIHHGTIDSDYRGEIKAVFTETASPAKIYAIGDKVAQIIIQRCEQVQVVQAEELSDTKRGDGGFGHTGK